MVADVNVVVGGGIDVGLDDSGTVCDGSDDVSSSCTWYHTHCRKLEVMSSTFSNRIITSCHFGIWQKNVREL